MIFQNSVLRRVNMTERTFIAIKPDAVQRGLIGKIIGRIEDKGYKIVALKMVQVSDEQAAAHYAEHYGKPFYPNLVKFITSAPIVAMVVEGDNAISGMRQIMGKPTLPMLRLEPSEETSHLR